MGFHNGLKTFPVLSSGPLLCPLPRLRRRQHLPQRLSSALVSDPRGAGLCPGGGVAARAALGPPVAFPLECLELVFSSPELGRAL